MTAYSDISTDDVLRLMPKHIRLKWTMVVKGEVYHSDSFISSLLFAIKHNAEFFEPSDHPNVEYL